MLRKITEKGAAELQEPEVVRTSLKQCSLDRSDWSGSWTPRGVDVWKKKKKDYKAMTTNKDKGGPQEHLLPCLGNYWQLVSSGRGEVSFHQGCFLGGWSYCSRWLYPMHIWGIIYFKGHKVWWGGLKGILKELEEVWRTDVIQTHWCMQ